MPGTSPIVHCGLSVFLSKITNGGRAYPAALTQASLNGTKHIEESSTPLFFSRSYAFSDSEVDYSSSANTFDGGSKMEVNVR